MKNFSASCCSSIDESDVVFQILLNLNIVDVFSHRLRYGLSHCQETHRTLYGCVLSSTSTIRKGSTNTEHYVHCSQQLVRLNSPGRQNCLPPGACLSPFFLPQRSRRTDMNYRNWIIAVVFMAFVSFASSAFKDDAKDAVDAQQAKATVELNKKIEDAQ